MSISRGGLGCSLVGVVLATSCATEVAQYQPGMWKPMGYEGFSETVNAVAGDDAVDCGFVNLVPLDSEPAHRAAFQCVQAAIRRGDPFKYGTADIPIDSLAYMVLAKPRGEDFWLRTYDVMISPERERAQWTKRCKSVRLNGRRMTYEGFECTELQ
jgi:hypothetical protein